MSHNKNETPVTASSSETVVPLFHGELTNQPWYRAEPWLVPCLLAFVALALAILLGRPMLTVFLGLAGLLLVSSGGLLLRQHARSRARVRETLMASREIPDTTSDQPAPSSDIRIRL